MSNTIKKKVAYILYNERPMSGLVKGQVIDLLKGLQCKNKYEITLICVWQPWVQFLQKSKILEMESELSSQGIKLESYPLAVLPSRYFMYNFKTLPILMGYLSLVFRVLRLNRFELIHSRSYVPSYVVAKLNKKKNYKSIFDMRSLLPEEYVTIGKWSLGSSTYNLWKKYEKYTVENSDAFIAVSAEMKRQAERIAKNKSPDLIHLMVSMDRLKYNDAERLRIRNEHGLENKFVIAYTGSLGFGWLWNNIQNYAIYYQQMKAIKNDLFFIFIVPEILEDFDTVLNNYGIKKSDHCFIEGDAEISSWLSAADAGIHVMSDGPDSATRFGVKVVEYVSNGLPVITNSGVGAAASFVEQNELGVRLNIDDEFADKFEEFSNKKYFRDRHIEIAKRLFSIESIVNEYTNVYERILN